MSAPSAFECAPSRYPLLTMRTWPSEPSLAVPRPPGWTPLRFGEPGALIRVYMANKEIHDSTGKFSPIVSVGLDDLTGKVDNPQAALELELRSFKTDFLSRAPGQVCGRPSVTVTYRGRKEPRSLITMRIVSAQFGERLHAAIIAVGFFESGDATYLADRQAILDGFVVRYGGKE